MSKKIATIIKSSSHIEYIAQVLNPPEKNNLSPSDYELGSFVKIYEDIVGIIYDTELFNPHSLSLSSQKEEFSNYAPDIKEDTDILLKILLLGNIKNNIPKQDIPESIIPFGISIYQLTDDEMEIFHLENNSLRVKYLSNLNNYGAKLNPNLFSIIALKLKKLLKNKNETAIKVLEIIEKNLYWDNIVMN